MKDNTLDRGAPEPLYPWATKAHAQLGSQKEEGEVVFYVYFFDLNDVNKFRSKFCCC